MTRQRQFPDTPGAAGTADSGAGWLGYICMVGATVAVLLASYTGVLAVLDRADILPPPALVNELCADEKLSWLRDHAPADPDLLIVGSSIAWRDVDSAQLVRQQPQARPLNAGFCHASVNQTAFVANYFLQHFASVRTTVAVFVPQDFEHCSQTPSALFNPSVVDSFVFQRRWRYWFYVSHFDPISLVRNASLISSLRDGRNNYDSLEMSPYGDGPLRVVGNRGLLYGEISGYDPACFAALRTLVRSVATSGRQMLLAIGPINPGWLSRFDHDHELRVALLDGVRAAVDGEPSVRVWDGTSAFAGQPSDFTDAIHINQPAAQRFSSLMASVLMKQRADTSRPLGSVR